jgi:hypothetical protein
MAQTTLRYCFKGNFEKESRSSISVFYFCPRVLADFTKRALVTVALLTIFQFCLTVPLVTYDIVCAFACNMVRWS